MIVLEYRKIEIDYCRNCSGIWFDKGELELLLKATHRDSSGLPSLDGLAQETRSHGRRKCPICGKKMNEVPLGKPAIHVDVCGRGDGMWFDGGELQVLLKQAAAEPLADGSAIADITAFLEDTFQAGKPDKGK
jgi:hypothetical protein